METAPAHWFIATHHHFHFFLCLFSSLIGLVMDPGVDWAVPGSLRSYVFASHAQLLTSYFLQNTSHPATGAGAGHSRLGVAPGLTRASVITCDGEMSRERNNLDSITRLTKCDHRRDTAFDRVQHWSQPSVNIKLQCAQKYGVWSSRRLIYNCIPKWVTGRCPWMWDASTVSDNGPRRCIKETEKQISRLLRKATEHPLFSDWST